MFELLNFLMFLTIIEDFFINLGDIITGLITLISDTLSGVVTIFWVASPDAGVTPSYFTPFGILMLLASGYRLVKKMISWMRSLVTLRG